MTPPDFATQTPPEGVDLGSIATRFTPISDATLVDLTERAIEIPLTREDARAASHRRSDITPRERSEPGSRAVNAAIAAVALLFLAPVFIVVGLLIKLTSPGPILYVQTRIGLDRRRRSART